MSYSAPTGHYPSQQGAFARARDVGPVHFPADAGVYRYGGGWPTSSWASAGYYVTPVVTYDAKPPPDTPADDAPARWSLVTDTTDIEEGAANDHQKVEVGVRFKVDTPASGAYVVKAVRFFRAKAMPENYVYIYDEDRKIAARGQFLTEGGPSGTVEVKLNAPLTFRPCVEYTASYLADLRRLRRPAARVRQPAERRAGALPGQRGRLPVRRRLPRRQLELLRLLRQPGRLLRRERDEPGRAAQHLPVGAVRWHDDDRRPGRERPGQGRVLARRFSVASPPAGTYVVRAVRFYRAPLHPMVENRVYVYDQAGTVVARGEAIGEGGPSGVVDVLLNAPLRLAPGTTYTASYVATNGYYASDRGAFAALAPRGRCSSPPTRASTNTAAASRRPVGRRPATTSARSSRSTCSQLSGS